MNRITVLLRADSGDIIGTAELEPGMLEEAGELVRVTIPWWHGSTHRYTIELCRVAEPVLVEGAAPNPAPEPEQPEQLEPAAGPEWLDALEARYGTPGSPMDLPADMPAPAVQLPPSVSITVRHPLILGGSARVAEVATPDRTLGAIAADVAAMHGVAIDEGEVWTLAHAGAGKGPFAIPFDPARCLTPAADGLTFELVTVPAAVHTGG